MKENTLHYVAVDWLHDLPNEPVTLFYELDTERHEHRKVEKFRNGTLHAAGPLHGEETTFLAWEPHPSLSGINADPQFRAREISRQEFTVIWNSASRTSMLTAALS